MAHIVGKLTKRQIELKSKPGRYADGSGLYLNVSRGLRQPGSSDKQTEKLGD